MAGVDERYVARILHHADEISAVTGKPLGREAFYAVVREHELALRYAEIDEAWRRYSYGLS